MAEHSHLARLFALTLGLSTLCASSPTWADNPPEHRILNLQAETSRDVANDEMQATLYTELNNSNPTALAQQSAEVINHAMAVAKDYPSVRVSTGAQSTYPIYSDKNKLTGWRSRAAIQLKTTDFKAGSELIAKLQSSMQLDGVNFSVSEQARQKTENELLGEITKLFRERATLLQNAWGASKYELVNINISSNSDTPRPYPMMMKAMAVSADSVPVQTVQSGDSHIQVVASGSIQLQ